MRGTCLFLIDSLAAHHGLQHLNVLDLISGTGHVVAVDDDEVGQFAAGDAALDILLKRAVGRPGGIGLQSPRFIRKFSGTVSLWQGTERKEDMCSATKADS